MSQWVSAGTSDAGAAEGDKPVAPSTPVETAGGANSPWVPAGTSDAAAESENPVAPSTPVEGILPRRATFLSHRSRKQLIEQRREAQSSSATADTLDTLDTLDTMEDASVASSDTHPMSEDAPISKNNLRSNTDVDVYASGGGGTVSRKGRSFVQRAKEKAGFGKGKKKERDSHDSHGSAFFSMIVDVEDDGSVQELQPEEGDDAPGGLFGRKEAVFDQLFSSGTITNNSDGASSNQASVDVASLSQTSSVEEPPMSLKGPGPNISPMSSPPPPAQPRNKPRVDSSYGKLPQIPRHAPADKQERPKSENDAKSEGDATDDDDNNDSGDDELTASIRDSISLSVGISGRSTKKTDDSPAGAVAVSVKTTVSERGGSVNSLGGGLSFNKQAPIKGAPPGVTPDGVDELVVLRAENASLQEQCARLSMHAEENAFLRERVQQLEATVAAMKKERQDLVSRLTASGGAVPGTDGKEQQDGESSRSGTRAQVKEKYGGNVVQIKNSANRASNIAPDPEEGVLFGEHGGRWDIKAGTVEKLVEKLYTPSDTHSVVAYVPIFLLTYRSFMSSEDLLKALVSKFNDTLSADPAAAENTVKRARICNFIKQWIEQHFFDFENDDQLVEALVQFCEEIDRSAPLAQAAEGATKKLGTMLDNALRRALTGLNSEKRYNFSCAPPAINIGLAQPKWRALVEFQRLHEGPLGDAATLKGNFIRGDGIPFDLYISPSVANDIFLVVEPQEIARQLTLVEFDIFKGVQPKELLNLNWMEEDKESKAPNVLLMIHWFNEISGWVVASLVCEPVLKRRIQLLRRWIRVAQEALRLENFNLIFEITSGLTNSAVFRLSKTWDGIKGGTSNLLAIRDRSNPLLSAPPGRFFQEMERIVSSEKNFRVYKEMLAKANPPTIPYLGVFLSNLTFIEQGNSDFFPDPMGAKPKNHYVNFFKRSLIAQVINQVRQYQQQPYNLTSVGSLQRLFSRISSVDENQAYEQSLQAEPREN